MPAEFSERCDAIEECYEFMLAYAGQGLPSDEGSQSGGQAREFLLFRVGPRCAGFDRGTRSGSCPVWAQFSVNRQPERIDSPARAADRYLSDWGDSEDAPQTEVPSHERKRSKRRKCDLMNPAKRFELLAA